MEDLNFFVFGDSICFGQLIAPHRTWATRLSSEINSLPNQRRKVLLQNASINGNTTRQALERMSYDVTSHQCDFLLIQFGMNDCNYWASDHGLPRVSRKAFSANLEEIIDRALGNKTKQVFLNTNHPSLLGEFSHLNGRTHAQCNEEYNEIIRLVYSNLESNAYPVTLIDIEQRWGKLRETASQFSLKNLLLPDGIHLNEHGHQVYAEIVIPAIIEKLRKYLQ